MEIQARVEPECVAVEREAGTAWHERRSNDVDGRPEPLFSARNASSPGRQGLTGRWRWLGEGAAVGVGRDASGVA